MQTTHIMASWHWFEVSKLNTKLCSAFTKVLYYWCWFCFYINKGLGSGMCIKGFDMGRFIYKHIIDGATKSKSSTTITRCQHQGTLFFSRIHWAIYATFPRLPLCMLLNIVRLPNKTIVTCMFMSTGFMYTKYNPKKLEVNKKINNLKFYNSSKGLFILILEFILTFSMITTLKSKMLKRDNIKSQLCMMIESKKPNEFKY